MKRLFITLFSALLGAAPLVAAAPAPPASKATPNPKNPAAKSRATPFPRAYYAPADRYFGKLKLSYLGINNTFKDATITAGSSTIDASITNKLDSADDALNDWAGKFPHDLQLARSYFLEERAFKKVWIKSYQERAFSVMKLIESKYPGSYFDKQVRADLKGGFTAHYYATPSACVPPPLPRPTPEPTVAPVPTPTTRAGRGRRDVAPTAAPAIVATPEPTPYPTATPLPGPTVTRDPRGYKISIEPVFCTEMWTGVNPPTPTPAPTDTPTPAPLPSIAATGAAARGAAAAVVPSPVTSIVPSAAPSATPAPVVSASALASGNAGDATFNEQALTLNGTRIPIVFAGMVPSTASFVPLDNDPQLRAYRVLFGHDVTLKNNVKLCGATPTFITVRRAASVGAYDIFLTVYKGATLPTGTSADRACGGYAFRWPAM